MEGRSEPWICLEGEPLNTKEVLVLLCIWRSEAQQGVQDGSSRVFAFIFFLFSKTFCAYHVFHESNCHIRHFICSFYLCGEVSSRSFSLGFLFLIFQLPSSHNVGSAFFFVLIAHCWGADNEFSCSLAKYWSRGFVTLQTAINAAIIQVRRVLITNVNLFQRHQGFDQRWCLLTFSCIYIMKQASKW